MRKRRQITAGANTANFWNNRRDVVRQHVQNALDHFHAHAAVAAAQTCGKNKQHAAHNISWKRLAHASRVRANNIVLQLAQLIRGHAHVGQRTKARVNSVHGGVAGGDFVHGFARAQKIRAASCANLCDAAKARHLVNHVYGERLAVQLDGLRVWHAQKIAGSRVAATDIRLHDALTKAAIRMRKQ